MKYINKCSVFALLLAFLMLIGIAYAAWSETLLINGTINTGALDWVFTNVGHWDPPNTLDHNGEQTDQGIITWWADKDVGYTEAEIVDPHTINVTIHNAYPGYANDISAHIHVNGTIPLIFTKVIINGVEVTEDGTVVELDLNGDGLNDTKIWIGDSIGKQLHPCNSFEFSFIILVLQDAPQGAELSFTMTLVGVQYNMVD